MAPGLDQRCPARIASPTHVQKRVWHLLTANAEGERYKLQPTSAKAGVEIHVDRSSL